MAKCPKCGSEIDQLRNRVKKEHTYIVTLAYGNLHYREENDYLRSSDEECGEYLCPECDGVIFRDWEKAKAFLMG